MKQSINLSLGIIVIILMASCKKKYNCNCDIIPNTSAATIDHKVYQVTARKKSDAKESCEKMFQGATMTISSYTCTLQ